MVELVARQLAIGGEIFGNFERSKVGRVFIDFKLLKHEFELNCLKSKMLRPP